MFVVTATGVPILALHLIFTAICCLVAAWLFENGRSGSNTRAAQYPFAAGLTLLACLGTLWLRHQTTAGSIGGPYESLIEMGANTLIWLGLAAALAGRFGPRPRASIFALEFLAFAGAATHALVAGLIFINPWWGLAPAEAPGMRGLNAIELGFGAPALAFLGYAYLRARQRMGARTRAAGAIGVTLLFATLILELRRMFHGAAMASAPVTSSEGWVYSIATLGFAAVLMSLSFEREGRMLRFASLGLALIAFAKMALFDLGALAGLPRVAASCALLAAGGALALVFRRHVLQAGPMHSRLRDPNLTPPR
jgi:uncharacterized membrane protein